MRAVQTLVLQLLVDCDQQDDVYDSLRGTSLRAAPVSLCSETELLAHIKNWTDK